MLLQAFKWASRMEEEEEEAAVGGEWRDLDMTVGGLKGWREKRFEKG